MLQQSHAPRKPHRAMPHPPRRPARWVTPAPVDFRRCLTHPLARAAMEAYATTTAAAANLPAVLRDLARQAADPANGLSAAERVQTREAARQLAEWQHYGRREAGKVNDDA